MKNYIIKKLILNRINLIINTISLEYNLDKNEFIHNIFSNYKLELNDEFINIVDIFNNIDIDELTMGETDYDNNELDKILS